MQDYIWITEFLMKREAHYWIKISGWKKCVVFFHSDIYYQIIYRMYRGQGQQLSTNRRSGYGYVTSQRHCIENPRFYLKVHSFLHSNEYLNNYQIIYMDHNTSKLYILSRRTNLHVQLQLLHTCLISALITFTNVTYNCVMH